MKRNSTSSPPGEEDSQSKKRRQLTEEETEVLKKEFEAHRDGKVPPPRKRELANELGLSEAQVFNWFNNHRQRHKAPNTPTLSIASSSSASSIRNTDEESESEVSPSEQQNHFSNGGKDGHLPMSSSQSSPSERPSSAILKDPFVINLMAENERLRNELTELRERLQEMNGFGNGEDDQHNGNHNHRRRSKTSHNHSKRGEEIEDEDHEAISAAVSCVASLFDKVPSLRKFAPQPYYALSSNGSNHNNSNRVNKSRA